MKEIEIYKLLKENKYKLTKQQYMTIKGQIKSQNYDGAYKGLIKCINKNR